MRLYVPLVGRLFHFWRFPDETPMYLWWDAPYLWWDGILSHGLPPIPRCPANAFGFPRLRSAAADHAGILLFERENLAVPFLIIASCADISIGLCSEPVMSGCAYAADAKICALNLNDESVVLKLQQCAGCGILAPFNFPGPVPRRHSDRVHHLCVVVVGEMHEQRLSYGPHCCKGSRFI